MKFGLEDVQREAASHGFRPDALEKVFRLLSLLEGLRAHPFLRPRMALKGGTALNLFFSDAPRLSADIDLNYVGPADRAGMLAEKPKVEQAIQAVCAREQLVVKRVPDEHAGGKWRLSYVNTSGSSDKLELDLNFMFRVPLWPSLVLNSKAVGPVSAKGIAVIDLHELAAGKLAALCSRKAARDVFDARELLRRVDLDRQKLRLAFVVYGGLNRRDWRTVAPSDITTDPIELKRELVPLLREEVRPSDGQLSRWAKSLVEETRSLLSQVLPLEPHELTFLDRLNDSGDIVPELLSTDIIMQERILEHPGLRWKAMNVKQQRLGDSGAPRGRKKFGKE